MASQASKLEASSSIQNSARHLAKYDPSIWGEYFLQYASEFLKVDDKAEKEAGVLKEEVRKMFVPSDDHNFSVKLDLIDSIQRLGVSYHFQHEIDEALKQIHHSFTNNNAIITPNDCDLHFISLLFRLLRQQGYHVSPDIFVQFKDQNGHFKEKVKNDVRGMLSFYEAAQLMTHGEGVLAEALDFTSTRLELSSPQLSHSLALQVQHSLRQPLHKGMQRRQARHYMSFYEDHPSHNDILLTFARFDFNMLRNLHRNEIGNITKWWKKSDLARQVPYARDRVVESYLWSLAISSEAEYSFARTIAGKGNEVMTLLDDTYDAYGTVQELELFTEAIKRWDASPISFLPECMKVVFETIIGLCKEIESIITDDEKSNLVTQYIKQAFYNLAQSYLIETKWGNEGYIPTYSEYKSNGVASSAYPVLIILFVSLTKFATKELLDWVSSHPIIIVAVSTLGRLLNDAATHKFEQKRVHVASSIECCMKQYEISEEEAYKMVKEDAKDCWNIINEECLKLVNVAPKQVLDFVVNVACVCEATYANYQDGFTNGELLKEHVNVLLVDPITV